MENEIDAFWKGTHISQFHTNFNLPQFPALVNSDDHVVLVQTPIISGRVPDCYPSIFDKVDYWDSHHVKLPCSEKNVTEDQINRWGLIREALSAVIISAAQLEAAILSYNKRFAEKWNFATLKDFFDEVCEEEETDLFFQVLFPKIVDLALCLPELITGGIPLLKHGHKCSVSLSQMQIASLLANAFFCTFPRRNSYAKGCEYANYPTINFTKLFQPVFRDRKKATYEKLRCIVHYFRRVTSSPPTGVVTYSRHFVSNLSIPKWSESCKKLTKLYVSSEGTIEDDGFGLYQVDFAHKLVGGGVIANGCVQEEIRFIISPELILSRLFTECLDDNEALIVTGCERFSKYKGYGRSFEWDGDYVDETPSDDEGRKFCTIIAIDALFFKKNPKEQYLPQKINRELNKAYAGFSWGTRVKREHLCGIATGNWGCGVYNGNVELKSLLQLMAAAECNRDLAYFTFADDELRDSMHSIHQFLTDNSITVGKIYKILCQFNALELYNGPLTLYEYVRRGALNENEIVQKAKENSNNVTTNVIKPPLHQTKLSSLFYSRPKKTADRDKTSRVNELHSGRENDDHSEPQARHSPIIDDVTKEMKKKESEMLLKMYASRPSNSVVHDGDDSFDLDRYREVKRICWENRDSNENDHQTNVDRIENEESIKKSQHIEKVNETSRTQVDENYDEPLSESSQMVPGTPPEESFANSTIFVSNLIEAQVDDQSVEGSRTRNDTLHENTNKSDIEANCDNSHQQQCEKNHSMEIIHKSPIITPGRSKSTLLPMKFYSSKSKRKNLPKKISCSQKRKISDYFSPT